MTKLIVARNNKGFSLVELIVVAVQDKSVSIVAGTIHYQPDGTLRGIGATLTDQMAKIFGPSGRTNGTGAGYRVTPLVSKKYRDRAKANDNRGLGYTFANVDAQIHVTRFGNFDQFVVIIM